MNDLISRQAAVDMLMERASNLRGIVGDLGGACSGAAKLIAQLPSAQPEIIRCKDCLWRIGSDCTRFTDLPVYMDDYCGRAKRRGEQDG